jgi:predicted small lipoprotein YifL
MQHNNTKAILMTLFLGVLCTACGQKRPLKLPEPAPTNQQTQTTIDDAKAAGHKE